MPCRMTGRDRCIQLILRPTTSGSARYAGDLHGHCDGPVQARRQLGEYRRRTAAGVAWRLLNTRPRAKGLLVMAVKVYLGSSSAAHSEMTYEEADAFNVTSGGFLLIQRQHAGEQRDLAVFAPNAWLHAEVVREPQSPAR